MGAANKKSFVIDREKDTCFLLSLGERGASKRVRLFDGTGLSQTVFFQDFREKTGVKNNLKKL